MKTKTVGNVRYEYDGKTLKMVDINSELYVTIQEDSLDTIREILKVKKK